jgi:cytochrome c oxidase cbb3-type subunit I/II
MVLMAYNLAATARAGAPVDGKAEIIVPVEVPRAEPSWASLVFGRPVLIAAFVFALVALFGYADTTASVFYGAVAAFAAVCVFSLRAPANGAPTWHRLVEGRALPFTALTVLAVLVGGVAELVPSLVIKPIADANSKPYRPLELEGRDVYVREGCFNCHSQMIRPFRHEQQRYGEPSTLADSQYDHPFQWGSKRTGPDLAREGGKYPNLWHYRHMVDPRSIAPDSNMPPYAFLATAPVDFGRTAAKVYAMRALGVPYAEAEVEGAGNLARAQAAEIAADLRSNGAPADEGSELVALVAYLQRLGGPAAAPAPAPLKNAAAQP